MVAGSGAATASGAPPTSTVVPPGRTTVVAPSASVTVRVGDSMVVRSRPSGSSSFVWRDGPMLARVTASPVGGGASPHHSMSLMPQVPSASSAPRRRQPLPRSWCSALRVAPVSARRAAMSSMVGLSASVRAAVRAAPTPRAARMIRARAMRRMA